MIKGHSRGSLEGESKDGVKDDVILLIEPLSTLKSQLLMHGNLEYVHLVTEVCKQLGLVKSRQDHLWLIPPELEMAGGDEAVAAIVTWTTDAQDPTVAPLATTPRTL